MRHQQGHEQPRQLQRIHGERAPPPAARDCGRGRAPQRRDRPVVGARRRSSRPPARRHGVGLDRSRRRRLRRGALRHPAADPWRVRAPSGLRHPLRLRKGRTTPRTARPGWPSAMQHRPNAAAARPRATPMGSLGGGVRSSRCPQRSCASRNAPRALTAFRASGDPQPRQRDHAAVPAEPLSASSTATTGVHRVTRRRRWR